MPDTTINYRGRRIPLTDAARLLLLNNLEVKSRQDFNERYAADKADNQFSLSGRPLELARDKQARVSDHAFRVAHAAEVGTTLPDDEVRLAEDAIERAASAHAAAVEASRRATAESNAAREILDATVTYLNALAKGGADATS